MNRIPDAPTLLQATADYLEQDLLPTLAGYHRFQTRISVNLLRTLQRELALAPTQQAAEQQRLQALLHREGDLDTLNAALANAMTNGDVPLDDPALIAHLRQTLRDTLAINSPRWALPDETDTHDITNIPTKEH